METGLTCPLTPNRFKAHLKGIMRSVDPHLDPSYLAPVAKSHISNLYVGESDPQPRRAPTKSDLDHPIKDVSKIKKRMMMTNSKKLTKTFAPSCIIIIKNMHHNYS